MKGIDLWMVIKIGLKITPTIIDSSLYYQLEDDQLVGVNGSYFDDLLRAGTDNWKTHSNDTFEQFGTAGKQQPPFAFTGMLITDFGNMFHIDLDFDLSEIEQIP